MTEAEAKVKEIVKSAERTRNWHDLEVAILALLAASRPGEGYIRTHEGKDLPFRGTLPVAKDGVVALPGAKVWPSAEHFVCNVPENTGWTIDEEAAVVKLTLRAECDIEDWDVSECYANPEAASAAKGVGDGR